MSTQPTTGDDPRDQILEEQVPQGFERIPDEPPGFADLRGLEEKDYPRPRRYVSPELFPRDAGLPGPSYPSIYAPNSAAMAAYSRAQSAFIQAQTYYLDEGRNVPDEQSYTQRLAEYSRAQNEFIRAQQEFMRQLGVM